MADWNSTKGGNSTSGGGGGKGGWGGESKNGTAGKPSYLIAQGQRRIQSEYALKCLAAGLCGLIAIFILFHWSRRLGAKYITPKAPTLTKPVVALSRLVRNVLIRKVPGFTSAGHMLLVTCYVAILASITFTNLDFGSQSAVAARFGWMAAGNIGLLVFLALKNTPLAFLTAYSYERINQLHRIAGYTTFLFVVLHASCYTSYFSLGGKTNILIEGDQICGMVAGCLMLVMVLTATFLRRIRYELFLGIHVICFIGTMIAISLHRPGWALDIAIIIAFVGSMWVVDRSYRFLRLIFYGVNNEATLQPLSNGGTQIVLKKAPASALPGSHMFVWIPKVRTFELHPFSVVSNNPLEFIVASYDGFTRDLHKYATANPGAKVIASVDGPYGTFADPKDFDKIILIAGGSGASFTFGLAVNLLQRMSEDATHSIVFIWAVKEHENLGWFTEHLDTIRNHVHSPKVSMQLHVTRAAPGDAEAVEEAEAAGETVGDSSDSASSIEEPSPLPPNLKTLRSITSTFSTRTQGTDTTVVAPGPAAWDEKGGPVPPASPTESHRFSGELERDPEKDPEKAAATRGVEHHENQPDGGHPHLHQFNILHHRHNDVKKGRPNTRMLIREAIESTSSNKRVLVAACGPADLMRVVRNTTADCIKPNGPAVELHCEQFCW